MTRVVRTELFSEINGKILQASPQSLDEHVVDPASLAIYADANGGGIEQVSRRTGRFPRRSGRSIAKPPSRYEQIFASPAGMLVHGAIQHLDAMLRIRVAMWIRLTSMPSRSSFWQAGEDHTTSAPSAIRRYGASAAKPPREPDAARGTHRPSRQTNALAQRRLKSSRPAEISNRTLLSVPKAGILTILS